MVFEEEQHSTRSGILASGTLACARCDAPVAPGPTPLSLSHTIVCPFCQAAGPVHEFLSLGSARPARVVVRVALAAPRASADKLTR